MLSSGEVPDSSSKGRSTYSWHQLANSIYFNSPSLCQNIHEQKNEDPRHRQSAATPARESAREGKWTACRAPGTVTTYRIFTPPGRALGTAKEWSRALAILVRLALPPTPSTRGDRVETLRNIRRQKSCDTFDRGGRGWGAGRRLERGPSDPAGHRPPGWGGGNVSWMLAPEECERLGRVAGILPGKREGSDRAARLCPSSRCSERAEAGSSGSSSCAQSSSALRFFLTPRSPGDPAGQPEFDFLGLCGEEGLKGLPELKELLRAGKLRRNKTGAGVVHA